MNFSHPLLLAALPPVAGLTWYTARARLGRLPWLRAAVTLGLRLVLVALLVAALAGPQVTQAAPGVTVVFVADQSAGFDGTGTAAEWRWLRAALAGRGPDDRASVVSFGTTPAWSGPLAPAQGPVLPSVEASGSNIEAGLRLALASVPTGRAVRLVLLSDGRQTAGDALAAATLAAARGVPVAVAALNPAPRGDAAVAAVAVAPRSSVGEPLTVRVDVRADGATTAVLRLWLDGAPLGQRALRLVPGLNTYFFAQAMRAAGLHVVRAQVIAAGDHQPRNNQMEAVTTTAGPPRVLLLAPSGSTVPTLAATLARAGARLTVLPASQAPRAATGLNGYDATVLANVPASALAPASIEALRGAVRDRGMGLLVAGGAGSYAMGGYGGSGLESLLPVESLAEAHAGHGGVGLILVIDESGSMSEQAHGVSKISMAQTAALEAITHLRANDSFGVIAFNDTTHIVVPFAAVGGPSRQHKTRTAINALSAFGNTTIYPALRQAARYLYASKAPFKHIVLLTDGQGETNAPFSRLIQQMKSSGISLSTIAIGSDAEVEELQSWAAAGGGRSYYTSDPRDIPRLVVLETRISSGPTRVVGTLAVRQAANDPVLRSLVGQQLPNLHAYNIVSAKSNAQVVLQSQLGDPVLAQWRYGLGQVSAWTGGSSADWALGWLNQTAFWSDMLHALLPLASNQPLQPDLSLADQGLRIGVDSLNGQGEFANLVSTKALVTAPDGRQSTLNLGQDAPGHFSATLPNPMPGVYRVTVGQYDNGSLTRQAEAAVAVPYAAAYRLGQANPALLASVAAASGGSLLAHPADAFSPAGLPRALAPRDIWPLPALLALLVFPLDVAIRVLSAPPRPSGQDGSQRDRRRRRR